MTKKNAIIINNNNNSLFSESKSRSRSKLGKPKRDRYNYTPTEIEVLESHYTKNQYIKPKDEEELAADLNLTKRRIKVWFQNRRMKDKALGGPFASTLRKQSAKSKKSLDTVNPVAQCTFKRDFFQSDFTYLPVITLNPEIFPNPQIIPPPVYTPEYHEYAPWCQEIMEAKHSNELLHTNNDLIHEDHSDEHLHMNNELFYEEFQNEDSSKPINTENTNTDIITIESDTNDSDNTNTDIIIIDSESNDSDDFWELFAETVDVITNE